MVLTRGNYQLSIINYQLMKAYGRIAIADRHLAKLRRIEIAYPKNRTKVQLPSPRLRVSASPRQSKLAI